MGKGPPYVAQPRNPLTGRQFRIRAQSRRELEAQLARIAAIRIEVRMRKRLAKMAGHAADLDAFDRELRALEHGRLTLQAVADEYVQRRDLSPDTVRRVRSFLSAAGRELAPRLVEQLDGAAVANWIEKLRASGGNRPSTIDAHWRTLGSIVHHAVQRGQIARLPWGDYRPRLTGRAPRAREAARTVEELGDLLEAAAALDDERDERGELASLEAKIACAGLLGLRQKELRQLEWPGINARDGQVSFMQAKRGTGGHCAITLLAIPELFAMLEKYRARLARAGLYDARGPVFPHPSSRPGAIRPYSTGEILTRRELRSAVNRAGLPHVSAWSAHSLRDTFVSLEALARGGDLAAVAARSRHGSIASLVRYLRSRTRDPLQPAFVLSTSSTVPSPGPDSKPSEAKQLPPGPEHKKKPRR